MLVIFRAEVTVWLLRGCGAKTKGRRSGDPQVVIPVSLKSGFDLEAPGLKQGFRNVLRILVPPGPFSQPCGAQVLVRRKLVFADHLLKFGNGGSNGPNRLRFPPVRISASFSHKYNASCVR